MGQPDFRAMNEQMVQRLLATPAEPIADGGYGLRVLEVDGRSSHRPRRTPVGLLMTEGAAHLVCPDRTRDWPQNVASAGRCRILGGETADEYTSTELHGRAAAKAVSAYLNVVTVPWARDAFRVAPDAGVDEIATQVDRMAVFALAPVTA